MSVAGSNTLNMDAPIPFVISAALALNDPYKRKQFKVTGEERYSDLSAFSQTETSGEIKYSHSSGACRHMFY